MFLAVAMMCERAVIILPHFHMEVPSFFRHKVISIRSDIPIERYTDFRTYLKFDLETTDQNGSKQLLSQTLNTKSGGETQTPFYIAMLASFAQLYQVNNLSGLANNTVRLVVFDEAFNKMDSDRIIESVRLLRKLGLQAIICTPPEKAQDIAPIADRTFVVTKNKYQMCALPFGKEIDGEWIRM